MNRNRASQVTVSLERKAVAQLFNRSARAKEKMGLDLQCFRNVCK